MNPQDDFRGLRSAGRVIAAATVLWVAGCACMGGGMLALFSRERSSQHEMSEGMCGGGMMDHDAKGRRPASQPTEPGSPTKSPEVHAHEAH